MFRSYSSTALQHHHMGAMVQITLTTIRPNAKDLMSGSNSPKFGGVVACRLLMPTDMAQQLVRSLGENLISAARPTGPVGLAQERRGFGRPSLSSSSGANAENPEPFSTRGS